MGTIVIRNGYVFDPLNEIDGEIKDIFIKDGKIVEEIKGSSLRDAKIIEAKGKTVMPGGVDSHSHVAGAKVNGGRMMCPEDRYKWVTKKTDLTHSGSGNTVPSTYVQGYDYAKMGYTTVFEAAIPPMEARHTHEEMRSTPILDMGGYLVLGNNWFIMRYLKEGNCESTIDAGELELWKEVRSSGCIGIKSLWDGIEPITSKFRMKKEVLLNAIELIKERGKIWRRTGGTHSSLICTREGDIVSFSEDVSRACSIDKAAGAALSSGRDLSNCALVTTGRLSGGMVAKAARAGIPIVVSKAAPLSTGVRLSKRVGMTLVAFVRKPNLYVYSGEERIV